MENAERFKFAPSPHRAARPAARIAGLVLLMAFPVIAILEGGHLLMLLPLGALPLIVWAAYLGFGQARRLEVAPARLSIVYRLRRRTVSLDKLAGMQRVERSSMAGLYGPSFSTHAIQREMSRRHGPLEVIAVGPADMVLIRLEGRRALLIGPADVEGFEHALRAAAKH